MIVYRLIDVTWYADVEGLSGQNVLQSVAIDWLILLLYVHQEVFARMPYLLHRGSKSTACES